MVKATRGHTFWGSLPLYSLSVPGVFCDSSLHYGVPPALLGSPSKSLQCTPPRTRRWLGLWIWNRKDGVLFLVWKANRPEEGSSQGQAWERMLRATLVFFTQGCGTDGVDYVLPSGHLRPPGHLHWLLGRDSFVSFIQPPLESTGWAVGMGDGSTEHHPHEGM